MDRSVDSIGSCSLDIDADSSDVSGTRQQSRCVDTSGSLNFPTPISIKDIPTEFTTNIRERCSGRILNDPTAGASIEGDSNMVLKQPTKSAADLSALLSTTTITNENITDMSPEKKPSYLNLACCVNGYSNLTTYDSKVRQDINKSREVSPIRPSSNSIQYCKKNHSLAPPVLHTMPNEEKICYHQENSGKLCTDGEYSLVQEDRRNTSFIQQRVERLYGPAALAQGFYSPKKARGGSSACIAAYEHRVNETNTSELSRKFQQLTPSKDFSEFRKKLSATASNSTRQVVSTSDIGISDNEIVDLPVLRHLSQEFRAQLPIISPKKNHSSSSPNTNTNIPSTISADNASTVQELSPPEETDVVDHKSIPHSVQGLVKENFINGSTGGKNANSISQVADGNSVDLKQAVEKDGNYFLVLLKSEQARLLVLAEEAEKYIDVLSNNGDAAEDTLGLLRSASGKARLLVSQKMKQFEGLCHKNINCSPEDKFPTTVDDLQGFWDMVNLQVDHINSIFADIEILKANNWMKPIKEAPTFAAIKLLHKSNKTANQKTKASVSNGSGVKAPASAIAMSAAAAKRESQRKLLQEMKRKNRIAMTSKSTTSDPNASESNSKVVNTIEIFVRDGSSTLSK